MVLQTGKHNKTAPLAGCLGLAAALVSACAAPGVTRPEAEPVRVVEVKPPAPMPSPALIQRLASLDVAIAQYPLPVRRQGWQRQLNRIETLAQEGLVAQAESESRDLQQEVREQSRRYYRQQAQRYIGGAEQFALLRRPQQDQLRAMQFAFERGEYRRAYLGGRALYRELWSAQGWVTVEAGDTLASIAGRRDVFDNPNLWPLLQQANKGLIRDPRRIRIGWRLRYPKHPRLDEIFAAVETATR